VVLEGVVFRVIVPKRKIGLGIQMNQQPKVQTGDSELVAYRRYRTKNLCGSIYCADALEFTKSISTSTVDLIFLDPPFNLGKQYIESDSRHDRRPESEYLLWMQSVLKECIRGLSQGGALYLYHLPKWALRFGAFLDGCDGLSFRHWIAVSMKNGFVRGDSLYPAHYALLYFSKGKASRFQRPKIQPAKCRHCSGTIKDYGGYKGIIEEKGVNLSDVWEDLSPVRHKRTKSRSQNELPHALTDRVLSISGFSGGVFVDPFAGSGSAVLSAASAGMKFLAADIVEANCALIDQRLADRFNSGKQG
jgi:site-specific DNA-methyltransferase (adenine-specific)